MTQRIAGVARGVECNVLVNGVSVAAFSGETIATALLASAVTGFYRTSKGKLRGPMCNMGVCFECMVRIDGAKWVRSCMTPISAGLRIEVGLSGVARLGGEGGGT